MSSKYQIPQRRGTDSSNNTSAENSNISTVVPRSSSENSFQTTVVAPVVHRNREKPYKWHTDQVKRWIMSEGKSTQISAFEPSQATVAELNEAAIRLRERRIKMPRDVIAACNKAIQLRRAENNNHRDEALREGGDKLESLYGHETFLRRLEEWQRWFSSPRERSTSGNWRDRPEHGEQ